MDVDREEILQKVAHTIRHLSIDAVQNAQSGHPGLPLGCAEIGAYLYGHFLRYRSDKPLWLNRDRFILSAGHGSAWLYSCLHLSGFDLSLEDLKQFRQCHSKTPGHPEYGVTPGVETTTGPLGQGIAQAVGHALALKILADKCNTESFPLFDAKVVVLAGDGCMMEGVSSEASSLAAHLSLNNLILLYDSNAISLDGPLSECCSEDVAARYRAYGWSVLEMEGNQLDSIDQVLSPLRENQEKPQLIIAHTTIGKGSPNKAGTYKVHGAPLGEEEVRATKEALGLSGEEFFIPQSVKAFFDERKLELQQREQEWQELFTEWKSQNPERYHLFVSMREKVEPTTLEEGLRHLEILSPIAGRKASQAVIQHLSGKLPYLYGGSADLSCSDCTKIESSGILSANQLSQRNIKFGVREFAMASICSGLAESGFFLPFCGTFLTFSDYMRNAIRLSALMKVQVIYQFTHDSIFLGEDGPTHQPVEHLASLRAIPNLQVIRPADAEEAKMAWQAALNYRGPTALILSRQKLPSLAPHTDRPFSEGMGRGAYIAKPERENYPIDYTFFASGSELSLAFYVERELVNLGKNCRIISMPCWEIFERQSARYTESLLKGELGKRVSIEAGVEQGWHKYIGREGISISIDEFGVSGNYRELEKQFGFTVEGILERIL